MALVWIIKIINQLHANKNSERYINLHEKFRKTNQWLNIWINECVEEGIYLLYQPFSNIPQEKHTRGLTGPKQVEKSVDCSCYRKDFHFQALRMIFYRNY